MCHSLFRYPHLSLSVSISPSASLSHPLLFFLSNPVICLRSSADNNVFYLRVTCTKGPPNWSMPGGWWALNRVLFQSHRARGEGGELGDGDMACMKTQLQQLAGPPKPLKCIINTKNPASTVILSRYTPIRGLSGCLLRSLSVRKTPPHRQSER